MCLRRPYHFKFFKGCLPQILLGPFLNTLTQAIIISSKLAQTNQLNTNNAGSAKVRSPYRNLRILEKPIKRNDLRSKAFDFVEEEHYLSINVKNSSAYKRIFRNKSHLMFQT